MNTKEEQERFFCGRTVTSDRYGIDLMWIPLGAGGWFVHFNGRVWEAFQAWRARRHPLDLYHAVLEVYVPEGRFVVENAWPIPDGHGETRGVVREGPVFARWCGAFRFLRYEVRRWANGTIYDAAWAVGGPRRITDNLTSAQLVLSLLGEMSPRVWGRRVPEADDMWNSNSTISWVLARSEVPVMDIRPPDGGRAPGWHAGICVALREMELGVKKYE